MTQVFKTLLQMSDAVFAPFDAVFLFGSSLRIDNPNDIDLLLVYEDSGSDQITAARAKVASQLEEFFGNLPVHLTTLSRSELDHSQFLSDVPHRRIRG